MSPSLRFSPNPSVKELETCSSIKCNGHLPSPLGNVIKIDIANNGNCRHNGTVLVSSVLDEKETQKQFSKITKVKGYFCQIGIFVLESFFALFCYVFGIFLLFNVLFAAAFSGTLRLFVRLIFATCYSSRYKLIDRGADALWAVETGFGASSSNIVIGLKCKGRPNFDTIVKTFENRVLNFKTRLRVKKVDGSYIQEESGEYYEPYEKLRWIIVEKFLFFCLKKDTKFYAKNHFFTEEIQDERESLDERLQHVMEKCITTRMNMDRPQWKFHIVTNRKQLNSNEVSEYGMVFTIQHAYGDAISWVQMFSHAFADEKVKPSIDPMGKSPSSSSHYFSSSEPLATRIFRWIQTVLLFPHYFSRQMVYVWRETNFFHGPFIRNNGTCRWNSSLSMKDIKAIRIPTSSPLTMTDTAGENNDLRITMNNNTNLTIKPTFTALLSSCITASFTKLFRDYKARVPGKLLAILPYADLPYTTLHPLNNFYSHFLPIPTSVTNSRARLMKCDKYTKNFNPPPTKPVNTLTAHLCGIMIAPLQKLVGITARSTLGFSNVPGPKEKIKLFGGDEVTSLILYPPLKYRTAIVVGFISYGDHLTLSICVDEAVQNHSAFASRFMEYFQEELQSLIELSQQSTIRSNVSAALSQNLGMYSDDPNGKHHRNSLIIQGRELGDIPKNLAAATSIISATSPIDKDFVVSIQNDLKGKS